MKRAAVYIWKLPESLKPTVIYTHKYKYKYSFCSHRGTGYEHKEN